MEITRRDLLKGLSGTSLAVLVGGCSEFKWDSDTLCYPDHFITNPKTKKNDFGFYCRAKDGIKSISLIDEDGNERVLAEEVNDDSYQNVFPEDLPAGRYSFSVKTGKGERVVPYMKFDIDVKNKRYKIADARGD